MKTRYADQVLSGAAALLRRDGHQTYNMGTVDGPKCMYGACRQAALGDPHDDVFGLDDPPALRDALSFLAQIIEPGYKYGPAHAICTYNNEHTAKECIAILEASAAGAKAIRESR